MSTTMKAGRRQGGYSLLELAVVLMVVALVVGMAIRLQKSGQQAGTLGQQRALLRSAHQAIVEFALTHHRLPCPDVAPGGSGVEAQNNGLCTSNTGGLPYVTLGLPMGGGSAMSGQVRYGVYSGATNGGADGASNPVASFANALAAASQIHPTVAYPYVPTDGQCMTAQLNPAFVLEIGNSAGQARPTANCFWSGSGEYSVQVDVQSVTDLLAQVKQFDTLDDD